ncbi:MAG: HD domain-containing protein [Rhodoferax sp.]|uniref:HD domain-containing phosphohydrolase n=1 Tax=Rhodoferax sp. TaxID=50421 RepID=UPI000A500729|nr:HD domain-containing phosphohydrolase [Rhodoferax sp.]MDP2679664.1 HD domain-containing protein [Rhodoferax sp.]
MSWFKQAGRWLGNTPAQEKVSVETTVRHLLASLLTMAWFVEARDPYTGGHLWRVSRYARLLASHAKLTEAEAARVGLGGFLHDLGKIGTPDAILRKTDRLTDLEYDVIKTHPDMGVRMLAGHPLAVLVKDAIHLHHERPDGKGYPLRLRSEAIPEVAKIVGICDAFDAMTSHRPYRQGMPRDKALDILGAEKGTQFDARFADLFISLGHAGELDHVLGHSDDGIPLQTCPMCGPTLVVRKDSQAGEKVYCRNCTGEFELRQGDQCLVASPTGHQGRPADLEPDVDAELIQRTVIASVEAMPAMALMTTSTFR